MVLLYFLLFNLLFKSLVNPYNTSRRKLKLLKRFLNHFRIFFPILIFW